MTSEIDELESHIKDKVCRICLNGEEEEKKDSKNAKE